jgi:hypothetical protein
MRSSYKILVGLPEGKRTLRRHRHVKRANIKDIGCEDVD